MKNAYEYKMMTSFLNVTTLAENPDFASSKIQDTIAEVMRDHMRDYIREAEEHERTEEFEMVSHSSTMLPNNTLMFSFLFRIKAT